MARLMRGLGSLALLVLGLAGIPIALALLGGNPLPRELTWSAVLDALLTQVDGTVLVGLISIVGWLAWLVFAVSVISELVAIVSQQRIRIRLPGLDAPQRFAAGLLLSVITMISVPQAVQADPAPDRQAVVTVATPEPSNLIMKPTEPKAPPTAAAPRSEHVEDTSHYHVVRAGDDLWSLAERYYGDGRDWRKIATANPKILTGGPDRLHIGWRLKIPDAGDAVSDESRRMMTVRRGDTLSSIAERELGSASHWMEIFRANRGQLSDPDELPVGVRLVLPKQVKSATAARSRHHDQHRSGEVAPQHEHRAAPPAEPSATPARLPTPVESVPNVPTSTAPMADGSTIWLAGVGGLLAAGVISGLALRRRLQLQARPQGRRIVHPPAQANAVEVGLGQRQRPLSLRTLDRGMRAIAAHCRNAERRTTAAPVGIGR